MTEAAMERVEPTANELRFTADGAEVALSVNFVRHYFCPLATAAEAFAFMKFCQYHGLNPYLRDAYLVKYDQKDAAQMLVGYHVWVKRAATSRDFEGFKSGIILEKQDGELERREGMFYQKSKETLVGGWCTVHQANLMPISVEVSLDEYVQTTRDGRPNRFWREKPATMIHKVALSTAFRLAFPSMTAGMYDESEMGGYELPTDHVIVDSTAEVVDWPAENRAITINAETGEILDAGEPAETSEYHPPFDQGAESGEGPALPPERKCPSCGNEKAPGVVVCKDCNAAGRTPEPESATSPDAGTEDPWAAFEQEVIDAGFTLHAILPQGSETIEAFEKIGGTIEIARKKLAEAIKVKNRKR